MVTPYFKHDKIEFVLITDAISKSIIKHRNDNDTWKTLDHILPVFDVIKNDHSNMYFAANKLDTYVTIGLVRITDIDYINSKACVGCDVLKRHRGKGYSKQIMRALIYYCTYYLNLHRLWLLVLEDNEKAVNSYKAVGFEIEGTLHGSIFRDGEYKNQLIMGLLR